MAIQNNIVGSKVTVLKNNPGAETLVPKEKV